MKNKAFTLLELLVVITIIGILSSIVIVSMSGSTDSATIAKGKAYAQQVHALLGSNAVGVWNFDEGSGSTVKDISGYGNNGTLEGDTHFVSPDINGYALSFDGTGDYIDCGDDESLNIVEAITVEAWLKLNTTQGRYVGIITKADSNLYSNQSYGLYFDRDTGGGQIWFLIADGISRDKTFFTAVFNEWIHVVGVLDDSELRIYKNSIMQQEIDRTRDPQRTINHLRIGFMYGQSYFSGLIDEVRIYAEALPATEIQKHYVQGLEKLLANQVITQVEYDQRMEEFNQSLTRHE